MFPSQGQYFAKFPCPFDPKCTRKYCHFSHISPAGMPTSSRLKVEEYSDFGVIIKADTSCSTSSSTTVQNKPIKSILKKPSSITSAADPIKPSSTMREDKIPNVEKIRKTSQVSLSKSVRASPYDTVRPKQKPASTPVHSNAIPTSKLTTSNNKVPPVTQVKIDTSGNQSSIRVAHKALWETTDGPPVIPLDAHSHTPLVIRQNTAKVLYQQFVRIYSSLPRSTSLDLSKSHTLLQESQIYGLTKNSTSYKSFAANILSRLKKRPPAIDDTDVGIDGEWKSNDSANTRIMLNREKLGCYIATREQLEKNMFPMEVTPSGDIDNRKDYEGLQKICTRCGSNYSVKNVLRKEDLEACKYHWGKMEIRKTSDGKTKQFNCCNESTAESVGCTLGPHVYMDTTIKELAEKIPFVSIDFYHRGLVSSPLSTIREAIAVDCEMSYTTAGIELVRITALDAQNGDVLLDELVFPSAVVIDLNTRFSGVKNLQGCKYNLREAMTELAKFVDKQTIIIGHGLENDMKAMRLVHMNIIDTVMLYPHPSDPTKRLSLRLLTNRHLKKFIQDSESGHDSAEDAMSCLELLRLKVEKGPQYGISNGPDLRN